MFRSKRKIRNKKKKKKGTNNLLWDTNPGLLGAGPGYNPLCHHAVLASQICDFLREKTFY